MKQIFSPKKDFIKNLFKVNKKKKLGCFEIKSDNVQIANNKQYLQLIATLF